MLGMRLMAVMGMVIVRMSVTAGRGGRIVTVMVAVMAMTSAMAIVTIAHRHRGVPAAAACRRFGRRRRLVRAAASVFAMRPMRTLKAMLRMPAGRMRFV